MMTLFSWNEIEYNEAWDEKVFVRDSHVRLMILMSIINHFLSMKQHVYSNASIPSP